MERSIINDTECRQSDHRRGKSFGASLAGIASVDLLKESPSYRIHARVREGTDGSGPGQGFKRA